MNYHYLFLIGLTLSYVLSLAGSISALCNTLSETEREFVAVERVKEFINLPHPLLEPTTDLEDPNVPESFLKSKGGTELTFRNVSVTYPNNTLPTLHKLNIEIQRGECVGIIGKNGTGKTTFFKTLLKLVPVDNVSDWNLAPCILIDDKDIQTIKGAQLRQRISVIPQEPFIENITVLENILQDRESPLINFPTPEIQSLLHHLPPLDMKCGENGSELSHGQRQLLAFVRELYRFQTQAYSNFTNLLILDEPTSSIDVETEKSMISIIRSVFYKEVTILVISHKPEIIKQLCERCINLENMDCSSAFI